MADAPDMEPMMGDEMEPMMEDDMMKEEDMMDKKMTEDDGMSSHSATLSEHDLEYAVLLRREVKYGCCFQTNLILIAIITGVLAGYQIGIIAGSELFLGDECSGIDLSGDHEEHDHSEEAKPSTQDREFFVSFFSLGAAFGAFFGSRMADWIGRKWTILLSDFVIALGFFIIIFSHEIWVGWVGRFVSGFGQGLASFAIPLYLNEVGTSKYNKIITAFFVLFTGGGIVGGLNLAIPFRHHWKQLYWYGLIPCVVLAVFVLFMPESQNWYVQNNRDEDALEVLQRGLDEEEAKFELKKLQYERRFFMSGDMGWFDKCGDIFTVYCWPFSISLILALFAQLVGTSAFLYYGPEVLKSTDVDVQGIYEKEESADIMDNFLVIAFVLGNLASAFLIYNTGRRTIILTALPVAVVTGLALSYTMYEANYGDDDEPEDDIKQDYRHYDREVFIGLIMIYLLAISIGLSNTIWGITSEITPSYLLAQMTGVVATFGWLVNFAVNSVFLTILNDPEGKWILFLVLAIFALLAFLFALFLLPETIGKSTKQNLEDLIGKEKLREKRKDLRQKYGIKDPFANSRSKILQDDFIYKAEPYKLQSQY